MPSAALRLHWATVFMAFGQTSPDEPVDEPGCLILRGAIAPAPDKPGCLILGSANRGVLAQSGCLILETGNQAPRLAEVKNKTGYARQGDREDRGMLPPLA